MDSQDTEDTYKIQVTSTKKEANCLKNDINQILKDILHKEIAND